MAHGGDEAMQVTEVRKPFTVVATVMKTAVPHHLPWYGVFRPPSPLQFYLYNAPSELHVIAHREHPFPYIRNLHC